jgi:hypothetical protein
MESVNIKRQGRKRLRSRVSQRFYTPAQFRDIFRRCGLELTATYGTRDGGKRTRGSGSTIVVGSKRR